MKATTLINRILRLQGEWAGLEGLSSAVEISLQYEIKRLEHLFTTECGSSTISSKKCSSPYGKYCQHYVKGYFPEEILRKLQCPHFAPAPRELPQCKRCGKVIRLPDDCLFSDGWCDKCFHDPTNMEAMKIRQAAARFSAWNRSLDPG